MHGRPLCRWKHLEKGFITVPTTSHVAEIGHLDQNPFFYPRQRYHHIPTDVSVSHLSLPFSCPLPMGTFSFPLYTYFSPSSENVSQAVYGLRLTLICRQRRALCYCTLQIYD
jgi:hypothetical protein